MLVGCVDSPMERESRQKWDVGQNFVWHATLLGLPWLVIPAVAEFVLPNSSIIVAVYVSSEH